ncbi:ribosome maturation factor RimM [Nereida sp. MMG025]|uniref:ribosome maturation factor RimM n=1 Tax=Nereida sp. MMG025 TaxID=2909981 RepID=UPI001EEEBAB5|nr:ribosome maturation factor RimM [Nereida sp. MMG025]MCF6444207.1 ribosome maturation factor RimM [Nereida sp. MMG025]
MTDLVLVGSIAGSYGVQGDVRIKSFCAQATDIFGYRLTNADGSRSFDAILVRPIKNGFAAQIGGVATKEEADALRGTELYASRDQLPDAEEDEYYYADLIGLSVLDTGGTVLGTVKQVMDHGAGDLLEVQGPALRDTVLVPFTKAVVPTVDLAGGRLVVDPPEGLFD